MGGRGSGGSRSGGGASANPPRLVSPNQYYQEKYRDLTDKELNRALINSRNLMNKENANLCEEIIRRSGVNPKKCMKCGKCSATCPAYDEMEYHPHQFVYMVESGDVEPLLNSPSIFK